jgi:hypothetical protein
MKLHSVSAGFIGYSNAEDPKCDSFYKIIWQAGDKQHIPLGTHHLVFVT